MSKKPFQIDHLDHVAIRVADIERSVLWYEQVLGLKTYRVPGWNPYPIFMLSGKTGIAIFPAPEGKGTDQDQRVVKIDHFAFHLSIEEFEKARKHYETLGIAYDFQDHEYFHSIYTLDPDGHKVELTTIVVPPDEFYL